MINLNIAIIDSHPFYKIGLTSLIKDIEGFKVCFEASDVDELCWQVDAVSSIPDICIFGLNHIKFKEFDEFVKLKNAFPTIKILVLSVYNHHFNIKLLSRAGCNGFLNKNISKNELAEALACIANGAYYHNNAPECCSLFVTETEAKILSLISAGLNCVDIAKKLNTTPQAARIYERILLDKFGTKSRYGLVTHAFLIGITNEIPDKL